MPRKRKLDIRFTDAEYEQLLEYKRENGHSTKAAAARDLIRKQVHYDRWKRSRRGKEARTEDQLRKVALEILRDHPDATKAALGYNIMKRAGKIVDAEIIKKIADELGSR